MCENMHIKCIKNTDKTIKNDRKQCKNAGF